jgi:hypothetical protein
MTKQSSSPTLWSLLVSGGLVNIQPFEWNTFRMESYIKRTANVAARHQSKADENAGETKLTPAF